MTPVAEIISADLIPGLRLAVYAEDQPQYSRLPAIVSRLQPGRATTRWRLTWRERFTLFLGGDLFIQILTFQRPLMPVKPSVDEPTAEECL